MTLMKETENTNKWRDIPCSRIKRLYSYTIHTKQSNLQIQCNQSLSKLMAFFTEIELTILTFVWNHKDLEEPNETEKEEQSWRHHGPSSQTILKSFSN